RAPVVARRPVRSQAEADPAALTGPAVGVGVRAYRGPTPASPIGLLPVPAAPAAPVAIAQASATGPAALAALAVPAELVIVRASTTDLGDPAAPVASAIVRAWITGPAASAVPAVPVASAAPAAWS